MQTIDLETVFLAEGDRIVVRGQYAKDTARRLYQALRFDAGRGARFQLVMPPYRAKPGHILLIVDEGKTVPTATWTVWANDPKTVTLIEDATGLRYRLKLPPLRGAHSDQTPEDIAPIEGAAI